MNKAELIDELARKLGTDRRYATSIVETTLDTIVRAVHRGESVTVTGLGVFEQRRRQARTARNPRTGEPVKTRATHVPVFRPGAQFKAIVSGAQRLPAEGQPLRRDNSDRQDRGGGLSVGVIPPTTTDGASAGTTVTVVAVDTVHPEQTLDAESAEVLRTVSKPVVQKEARLTEHFQQYLESHGREVMRYRVTPVEGHMLYSDLADITENLLYEAKGSADRMSVRLALGQVLDYGRYVEGSRLAVLLPGAPADDLVELLEQHHVGCVIETAPGQFVDLTTLGRCPYGLRADDRT